MLHETVELFVDYEKAGLPAEGCKATLDCFCSFPNEELQNVKHRALIVCPGGGYDWCSKRESEPVALRFLGYGVNCFTLNYSCVNKKFPTAALECAAAVKYVRENAEKYNIDPNKIFLVGFSAGGHLAASVANLWNSEILTKPLECQPEDIKVNGCILGYPVITSDKDYTHEGSILNIIGEEQSAELREFVSMENRVNEHTPPTFIWHCADDGLVNVYNSLAYMTALSKYHIPFESHIYEWGGHGLSLCDETTAKGDWHIQPVAGKWIRDAIDWILRL